MLKLITPIFLVLCTTSMFAQSDATPKGATGFEAAIGKAFVDGKDPFLVALGFSVDGQLDLGLGYTGYEDASAVTIGTSYHFGGEANDAGLNINLNYVIFSEGEDYATYGAGVYANLDAQGANVIPSLNFLFASLENSGFFGNVGLSVITKGKVALAFRPSFTFGRDEKYLGLTVGVMTRSFY
jgi:hypothetical protein